MKDRVVEIPLTRGCVAVVSHVDADLLGLCWHISSGCYAQRSVGPRRKKMTMRSVVMARILGREMVAGEIIDHVNGDRPDNRRENLRLATHSENMWNGPRRRKNASGFKGVRWNKRDKRYVAQIAAHGKRFHVGYFSDASEAARAYDAFALALHGEYARLNFPGVRQWHG